ncbi:MAG: hypothetical protein AAF492_12835 [Verrucomicrobiota bacterium]
MTPTDLEQHTAKAMPGFDEAAFNTLAAGNEPEGLKAKREAAYALYGEFPSPTARTEEWRRTDPALFPFGKMSPTPLDKNI